MKLPFIFLKKFLVPTSTVVSGDISSGTNGNISGLINGNVKTSGNVIIQKEGTVNGDVHANNVWIKGKVKGSVHCQGKVYADKFAEITGNVYAREAVIDKESKIKGGIAQLHKTSPTEAQKDEAEEARLKTVSVLQNKPEPDDVIQNWF